MTIIEHLLRKNLVKFKEYNGILYSKKWKKRWRTYQYEKILIKYKTKKEKKFPKKQKIIR